MKEAPDARLLQAILRADLPTFVVKVLQTVSPADPYHDNWHVRALTYQLQRTLRRETTRLIVNMPPRSLKSIAASVALVAWALGHDPTLRFACISYSNELAAAFARQFRLVVNAPWYRDLFPTMRLAKDTEVECETTLSGGRLALSVGGSITGRGADIIIIDDPMKAEDAQSEAARRTVADWFATTLLSRLNDKKTGAIVLLMQRLHEDDLAGVLLQSDSEWQHLSLPAIASRDQVVETAPGVFHDWREGEALHPAREPLSTLEGLRRSMGSQRFSAQYLQQPVPASGNLIRRTWLRYYDVAPVRAPADEVVQSWDIASTTSERSDYSACTTWLSSKREYYLIDVWRGRLEFPLLKRQVAAFARQHEANRILIEDAGPGQHLLQEFRVDPIPGVPMPLGIRPEGDKIVRMEAQSARFEAGQVFLPREAPWMAELLHELLAFPYSRHDDQVDSASMFLNWAESRHTSVPHVSLFPPIIIRA